MLAIAAADLELAGLLARLDAVGVSSIDMAAPSADRRVVLVTLADEEQCEPVAAALRAEGRMAVTRPAGGAALTAWMRATEPVVVADRVSISLAWSEHSRADLPGPIELGPGGFGSGHHPTTRLIMDLLAERLEGGERLLDVGCGSGILALAAVGLGAESALGLDLKPAAVEATRRNAELNGLAHRVSAVARPLVEIGERFDVLVANIAREGVVALADDLVAAVAPGGWLAVSGITPAQCAPIAEYLRPLQEIGRITVDGWSVLVVSAAPPAGDRSRTPC